MENYFVKKGLMRLNDEWECEMLPVLDNRYGDFHYPGSPELIRPEIRHYNYAASNDGRFIEENLALNFEKGHEVTYTYGEEMLCSGPTNEVLSDEELAAMTCAPVNWKPYVFSRKWGVLGDAGHQGYHGLKAIQNPEVIRLGKKKQKNTTNIRLEEKGGRNYYLFTTVNAPQDGEYEVLCGATRPSRCFVGGKKLDESQSVVNLKKGITPVLLCYEGPTISYFFLRNPKLKVSQASPFVLPWHEDKSILAFDPYGDKRNKYGWYSFESAPGLKAFSVGTEGKLKVWIDGKEAKVKQRENKNYVELPDVQERPAEIVLRVELPFGVKGGNAITTELVQYTANGKIKTGDWGKTAGLRNYSGGVIYRQKIDFPLEKYKNERICLCADSIVASATLCVNGREVGVKNCPDWKFDISDFVIDGENLIEITVYNTAANHYETIPTPYVKYTPSGLIGNVWIEMLAAQDSNCGGDATCLADGYGLIENDVFKLDDEGNPIMSQGGGIFKFVDPRDDKERYFWYGVRYVGSRMYYEDYSQNGRNVTFEGVSCYSSDNLIDWHYEGDILTPEEITKHSKISWVGRLGVAYIPEAQTYALFVQQGSGVLIATCDSPIGEFTWSHHRSMKSMIGTPNTGDQTVFTDPDTGISYLVYSYGKGRNIIYVSEIGLIDGKIDLKDCTSVFNGASREGNCMFKYNGKYYMCASNIYGWDSSFAYYLVADDIRGPYLPENDMQIMKGCEKDYAHVSQTGFFYVLRGTEQETVIYCGDRWSDFAGNGIGFNQWVPLSFDKDEPYFNSLSAWRLNPVTGKWSADFRNNYVKNGSFEADRQSIPSIKKPRQDYLLGWQTDIISGNEIMPEDPESPRLNYMNDQTDRRYVIGEKSLRINDSQSFERMVWQDIESSPFVPLADGVYRLTAKVRRQGDFDTMTMFAESSSKRYEYEISDDYKDWSTIGLDIELRDGKVRVGFYAKGMPDAQCLIDDVALVKKKDI